MVATTIIGDFAVELAMELKPNQLPQWKKRWGLGSVNIKANDYDLDNNLDVLGDSIITRI
jgi:hypothetical protein